MPFKIIGYVGKPYGLEGKFFLSKPGLNAQALRSLKYVYVGKDTEPDDVLALRSVAEKGDRICLSLETVTTREDAQRMIHSALFVGAEQLASIKDVTEEAESYIGYQVVQGSEVLGEVTDWLLKPVQDIMIFKSRNGSEVMVPVVDEFIIDIDRKKGRIRVRLLEGMLDEN
ncbi:MAG: hypothetical protein K0B52_05015 [FCB group bacterium]|nr:hypothetical protein [FCB group bacterium]